MSAHILSPFLLAIGGLCTLLMACQAEAGSDRAPICSPGVVSGCPCASGGQGSQQCRSDGSGFSVCGSCADELAPGAGQLCVPGQSMACACADGGSGAQTCLGDGSAYASCQCTLTAGGITTDAVADLQQGGGAGDGAAMAQIQYPPCPEAFICQALPAAPDQPVCLDPVATGLVLPPPCDTLDDCTALGLDPNVTQCLETVSTGNDFGTLCFSGCDAGQ